MPVVWLARYVVRGLAIVGLSLNGRPYQSHTPRMAEAAPAVQVPASAPLTPDELLWQAELE